MVHTSAALHFIRHKWCGQDIYWIVAETECNEGWVGEINLVWRREVSTSQTQSLWDFAELEFGCWTSWWETLSSTFKGAASGISQMTRSRNQSIHQIWEQKSPSTEQGIQNQKKIRMKNTCASCRRKSFTQEEGEKANFTCKITLRCNFITISKCLCE